jgi:tRNA (guanine26-N2/guanine27-N2)-dimethyltransferase
MLGKEHGRKIDRKDKTDHDINQILSEDFTAIREGFTTLIVPSESVRSKVPPRAPAFFNPVAKLSRDISFLVYGSFIRMNHYLFQKVPISFADAFCGVGARSIRVANEIPSIDKVVLNDLNPVALTAAKRSAKINGVEDKCVFSQEDVHVFLNQSTSTNKKERYVIADLDPFGSPSAFVDSFVRAVTDGGLLSVTATDTAVLFGKYPNVCFRKYYSKPINCTYSNEIAVRIMISFLGLVAGRMDLAIEPIFAHSHRHYSRVYVRVHVNSNEANQLADSLGHISHCFNCGDRRVHHGLLQSSLSCNICDNNATESKSRKMGISGPIWIKPIFNKYLISDILAVEDYDDDDDDASAKLNNGISNPQYSSKHYEDHNKDLLMEDHRIEKTMISTLVLPDNSLHIPRQQYYRQILQWLQIANAELDDQPLYYTLDEVGSAMKSSPPAMNTVFQRLNQGGFKACRTSFRPTGFKTNATMEDIKKLLY